MQTLTPYFSVVITTYNYAQVLERAVRSVCRQLDSASELLVIDDGSTDDTPDLCQRLKEELPENVRFIRQDNAGAAGARNTGIEQSRHNFLLFLDADDELLPDAFASLRRHLEKNPGSRLVVGGHITCMPDGQERQHLPGTMPENPVERVKAYLIDKTFGISNGAFLIHRSLFARAIYPTSLRNTEDIPVFAQALANPDCSVLPVALARIHRHHDSLRHRLDYAIAAGTSLVDEVFRPERLGPEFQQLKPAYQLQRCLSLFRTAYTQGDRQAALGYYRQALSQDWRVIGRASYLRKAIRLWLRHY